MTSFFKAEYILSVTAGLGFGFLAETYRPDTHPVIKFFVLPLTICYIVLLLLNYLLPKINETSDRIKNYAENKTYGEIYSMNYFVIFPPVFFGLLLFLLVISQK